MSQGTNWGERVPSRGVPSSPVKTIPGPRDFYAEEHAPVDSVDTTQSKIWSEENKPLVTDPPRGHDYWKEQ